MWRNFVLGCFTFSLVFHAKSGIANNHWNGSSDISFKAFFSSDSNDIQNVLKVILSVENNRFKIFEFSSNFERVKRSSNVCFI